MPKYQNTLDFSMCFTFTSERRLNDFELGALHKALQSALSQEGGPADQLQDALQEQVADLNCGPDNFETLGPAVLGNGYPINDALSSDKVED